MDKRLDFNYCTIATSSSVISSQRTAEKLIAKRGFRGTVELCRVIIDAKHDMPCWVCRYAGNMVTHIMPVFRAEPALTAVRKYGIEKMRGNELFCYGDTYFRTYCNRADEMGIRAVLIFPDEALVRAACQAKGYNVVSVNPVRVLDAKTRRYLTAAWCVKCMDCNTDFAITYIDLRDSIELKDFDLLKDAVYQDIKPKENFTVCGIVYKALKNRAGEWFLNKGSMQVYVGRK